MATSKNKTKMTPIKMSPPWFIYLSKLNALFGQDPDVRIEFDEPTMTAKLFVNGKEKSDAFIELFPSVVKFGNVELSIEIIPGNLETSKNPRKSLEAMFAGNPVLSYIQDVRGVFQNPISYFVLQKEVVQIWEDNMSDANGIESTLYQTLAKEILGNFDGIFFCTDIDGEDESSEDVDEEDDE